MNRKLLSLVLAAALIAGSAGFAFAQDTETMANMDFIGDAIKLSLNEATAKMQTDGPGAEAAALNLKAAKATARGYNESIENTNEMLEKYSDLGIISSSLPTESDVNLVKLQRDFAGTQGAFNFEAEMNALEIATVQNYFMVLQAQDAVKIQEENLAVQQRIASNTQKKFDLGMVAKQDVLQAEIAVLSARDGLTAAQNALKLANMGFNNLLGYEVMQALQLTDTLQAVEVSSIPLEEAISMALTQRNEIKAAAFGVKIQNVMMNRIKYRYPSTSATYLKQQVAMLNAQTYYNSAITGVEIDVRSKYMAMMQAKEAIEKGTASVTKARELLRLSELSYSVGINTIADVQQVQILLLGEELGLSQAILTYDLAVYSYEIAAGVGTFSAPL